MSRGPVILVCLFSAAAGALATGLFAAWFFGKFAESAMLAQTQAAIVTKGKALELLRTGRVDEAERMLTIVLDGDLIAAYHLAKDGWSLDDPTLRQLNIEKQARVLSGYKPEDAGVRSVVEAALDLRKR